MKIRGFFREGALHTFSIVKTSAAADFAAKEAFLKALGPQIGLVKFCEIEVLREASGRPVLHYLGPDERLRRGRYRVSLSHDRGRAVAVVLAQWEEDEA